jgi:hypothetical protein
VSIAATAPINIVTDCRRASGGASAAAVGLKLNATIINEADETQSSQNMWYADAADDDRNGMFQATIGSRVTGYLDGIMVGTNKRSAGTNNTGSSHVAASRHDNPFLTVAVTSIIIRGAVAGSETLGIDELQVHSWATS